MMVFTMLAVSFFMKALMVIFAIVCLALILIVLVQKGRGGGLSAAFGGGMAGGILGSKTGDFLTWVTVGLVCVFLFLSVIMAKFYRPTISSPDAGITTEQTQPFQQQPLPWTRPDLNSTGS